VRYFLAIICPPLAVFLCGKPIQAILALFLWFLFWIPGSIYALIVVGSHKADQRTKKMIKAVEKSAGKSAAATIKAAKIAAKVEKTPHIIINQQINQQITLRIAKDGSDMGDVEISAVRQMVQTGVLQPTDYYFDYEKNEWLQLESHSSL